MADSSFKRNYEKTWLAFVQITAKPGFKFIDLVDSNGIDTNVSYVGAWANIILKSNDINVAIEIITLGLNELNFDLVFIDKVENLGSLIEYNEVNEALISEVNWLMDSEYVFKISNKLFPYE